MSVRMATVRRVACGLMTVPHHGLDSTSAPPGLPPASSDDLLFVVEDECSVRKLMENALILAGYTVVAFADAEAALDGLRYRRPNLVLTDCRLPGMSGVDLASEMSRRYPDIPVIGMSGEHFKGQAMIDAGAEVFLEKPLDIASLWKTIAAFVRVAA